MTAPTAVIARAARIRAGRRFAGLVADSGIRPISRILTGHAAPPASSFIQRLQGALP